MMAEERCYSLREARPSDPSAPRAGSEFTARTSWRKAIWNEKAVEQDVRHLCGERPIMGKEQSTVELVLPKRLAQCHRFCGGDTSESREIEVEDSGAIRAERRMAIILDALAGQARSPIYFPPMSRKCPRYLHLATAMRNHLGETSLPD